MGTTSTYALPYPELTSPHDVPLHVKELADRLELVLPTSGPSRPAVSYGTSPPASPADGDLWYYPADATNGAIWCFRYRSAASIYKWEYVGGSPLCVAIGTTPMFTTSWQRIVTHTPPRFGDYLVRFHAWIGNTSGSCTQNFQIIRDNRSGDLNNTLPSYFSSYYASSSLYVNLEATLQAIATTIDIFALAGAGTSTTNNPTLIYQPVRVT